MPIHWVVMHCIFYSTWFQVRDNLMPIQIEVNPLCGTTTLWAT